MAIDGHLLSLLHDVFDLLRSQEYLCYGILIGLKPEVAPVLLLILLLAWLLVVHQGVLWPFQFFLHLLLWVPFPVELSVPFVLEVNLRLLSL